jgi:hypothetical protein
MLSSVNLKFCSGTILVCCNYSSDGNHFRMFIKKVVFVVTKFSFNSAGGSLLQLIKEVYYVNFFSYLEFLKMECSLCKL